MRVRACAVGGRGLRVASFRMRILWAYLLCRGVTSEHRIGKGAARVSLEALPRKLSLATPLKERPVASGDHEPVQAITSQWVASG